MMWIRKSLLVSFICLIVLCLRNYDCLSEATQTWGAATFVRMTGEALEKAQKGLINIERINDPSMFDDAYIDYVTIANDTVIVCSIEYTDLNNGGVKRYDISLYDLKGNYIDGYKLRFDRDNGVYGIALIDGELLYYRSVYKCIYKLSKSSVEYYYVPPGYTQYLHSYMQATSYIVSYDQFTVDITDPFGHTKRLIDRSKNKPKLEEFKNSKRQAAIIISLLQVLGVFCCLLYLFHRSKHE